MPQSFRWSFRLQTSPAIFTSATLSTIRCRTFLLDGAALSGDRVLWLPGTDHAGIATQMVVERFLNGQGIKRRDLGREQFVARIWDWREHHGGTIQKQMRTLGESVDWSRERFTLDEGLSSAVREVFVRLYDEGLIYRGEYLVNWSPGLQTAVSILKSK